MQGNVVRRRLWLSVTALSVATLLQAVDADAEELRAHGTLGLSHAAGAPQYREFGWGGAGSASLELPLGRALGVEGKVAGHLLSKGEPVLDPSVLPTSTGTAAFFTVGPRLRPFTEVAGPWLSAGLGLAQTGSRARFGLDSALGYDFRLSRTGRWDVGPYVGYSMIVQPDDSVRPNDAHLLSFGVHVGLGVAPKAPPPRGDRDTDGIYDDEDACPDVPGIRTPDPRTNGCPRGDRDKDGIFDDEDACPDVPGIRTGDPKTNGCPRADRDKDGIYDDEDACPDVPGIRTEDPKTNGCPRSDRDGDGVFDDEDACPDIPGVRSLDPKTNGCPPASDSIRVEKDRILLDDVILFDIDSPRVRHRSWAGIQKLAEFIKATPDILEVSIEGHADATGTDAHNLYLSRERAESVKRLLVRYGVAADRLKAESFGRSRLRVQTTRAEQKNRRVEFWVTRARPAQGGTSDPTKPVTPAPGASPKGDGAPEPPPASHGPEDNSKPDASGNAGGG